jgi:hypothetical protein
VTYDPALEEKLLEETAKLEDLLEKSEGRKQILDLSLIQFFFNKGIIF